MASQTMLQFQSKENLENYHPRKDKSKTNRSIFCPVVICLDNEKASSVVILGFSANKHGIIEYSYAFIIPGTTSNKSQSIIFKFHDKHDFYHI